MRNLDRKLIAALLIVVIAGAVFFVLRNTGALDDKPVGTTMLETPPLPTKPPLK